MRCCDTLSSGLKAAARLLVKSSGLSALLPVLVASALAADPGVPPPAGAVRAAIGRFDQAGFSLRAQCTVVLVAPAMVATAAHCVSSPVTRERAPAGHVLLGYDRMRWIAHRREKSVLIPDKTRDIALVCLDAPATVQPLPVAPRAPGPGETLVVTGYGAPASQQLTDQACRVVGKAAADRYVLDCSVAHGSSGGPVLRVEGGRTEIVGILSRSSETRSLFTRLDPRTVAAASCR